MATPTRSKRPENPLTDGNTDMVRGSVLIGIAVIIAVVLLYRGFADDDSELASAPETTTTSALAVAPEGTDDAAIPSSTIGTAPASSVPEGGEARPNSEISVIVANGSPVAGVAGRFTSTLQGEGFVTVDPDNASQRDLATSVVYYAGDDQAEAEKVAEALGIPTSSVAPVADPPPLEDGSLNGATVVVVIGSDLAGG